MSGRGAGKNNVGVVGGAIIAPDALQTVYFHNTVSAWLLAIVLAALTVAGLCVARGVFLFRGTAFAERHPNGIIELLVLLARRTWSVFLFALGIKAGLLAVTLPGGVARGLSTAMSIVVLAQLGLWGASSSPSPSTGMWRADLSRMP